MMDITIISTLLSNVNSATEIAKLIKDSTTTLEEAEIKYKMAELIGTLADIKIELADIQLLQREKEEKILELEKQLFQKNKMTFKKDMYFMVGDKVPFCKVCFEKDSKYHHLDYEPQSDYGSEQYHCRICNNYYYV